MRVKFFQSRSNPPNAFRFSQFHGRKALGEAFDCDESPLRSGKIALAPCKLGVCSHRKDIR
jgi:hypothetical protein